MKTFDFDLSRRVREAADELRDRLTEKAKELRRKAEEEAERMVRDVGQRFGLEIRRTGAAADPGCPHLREPVNPERNAALGPRTRALVETMAEVLERSGYREVCADLPGRLAPELVRGTVRSHRPSLSAIGGGRPILIDVFDPSESSAEVHLSRWQLFSSAADQLAGEFHVVVPAWMEGVPGRDWARRVGDAIGADLTKIWEC